MAASFVNYHLHTADAAAVARVAEEIITAQAFVSPSVNGWVTVFDETSDSQDPLEIDRLAHEFSEKLHVPLMVFMVINRAVFVYYLFDEEGCLIDEYNSAPEYFGGEVSDEIRERFAGRPIILEPLCRPGTAKADIEKVLGQARLRAEGGFASAVPADERLRQLAVLLAVDEHRAKLGFRDFQKTPLALADSANFIRIQSKRRLRNPRTQVLPRIPPRK